MPAIELKNLSKQYAPGQSLSVNNVDLEIHNGELLCLLGPSGCGKTTTLRMLAGLESVTSGTITVGDHVWDDPAQGVAMSPNKRRAPMVFQSYALWPHLTVRDNVAFGLKTIKTAPAEREREVNRVLTQMSIVDYADRYPADLSGGQQQRVALARALAMRPELLLMDEPLSNLDATLRVKMRAEIIDLHRETATTIVMVTHDQWEAMTLASRIALMNNGEIIQVATPRDIYKDPVNRFVAEFIGNPPINIIELERRDVAATALDQYISRQWGTPFAEEASSVGIRPEDITISTVRNDDSLIVGKIVSTAPTGGAWITDMEVGSTRLHMTHLKEASVAIDDEVYLAVDPKSLLLFDEEGNRVRTPNNL